MKNYLYLLFENLNKNKKLVIFSIAVFILGIILGCALTIGEELECVYKEYLSNYLVKVIAKECSPFKILLERIVNCLLILLLVAFLSLNKYTFYLNYLIIFYRAFILGLAGKLFITGALISGLFAFIFLILAQALFLVFAIVVFMSLTSENNCYSNKKSLALILKYYLFSIVVAIAGAVIEFIFIVFMFRPINLYF